MKGLCIFFLNFLLIGCVQAPIAPNLKLPDRSEKICPKVALPPIGQRVLIDIDGDKITTNADGERLLRGYVLARELLK